MRVDLDWTVEGLIIALDKDKQMEIFHSLPALLHAVRWCPSLRLTLGCPSIDVAISSLSERVSDVQGCLLLPFLVTNCERGWVLLSIIQVRFCKVDM